MDGGHDTAAYDADDQVERVLDALRECRAEQGMSQASAAQLMHCSKGAVSMLETGARRALLATVLRYAQVVGADVTITVRSRAGRQLV